MPVSPEKQCTIIYSDLLSVVKKLVNPINLNSIYTQILNKLHKTKNYIRFMWVPEHNNNVGNEVADEIAKNKINECTTL